ncbi:MAG: hypothetical protein KIT22_03850 [Verrucomicrobiae bacterium]|nr:hypothetical protein [Verrucomicrobiae bacterium]
MSSDGGCPPSPHCRNNPARPALPCLKIPGLIPLANGIIPWREGGAAFDYFFRPIQPKTDQGGEIIHWERP